MKLFLLVLLTISCILSDDITNIKADLVTFNIKKKIVIFQGNIKYINKKILMNANYLDAIFDNNKLQSFNAKESIYIQYKTLNTKYKIRANSISYDNKSNNYIIMGDVSIEDNKSKKILANRVLINIKKNIFKIEGKNKPAILEFKIKE
jgi:lipopolysaccharide transport protein LptA